MRGFKKQEKVLQMSSEDKSIRITTQNIIKPIASDKNFAIKVAELSKCYQIYNRPSDRLRQFIYPKIRKFFKAPSKKYFKEFWALKDISFEILPGETVGIIGCNGSGKSTLLQIICGTLSPTNGAVETNGRVAALLELGSGFNPEFSGKENIYLNASILGLSKSQIDQKFDEIVNFADIGEFLEQPVKTYSSGMVVRLAFAVQSQVDPDILIVDEALAVGDAKFQAKCFERLRQLKERGTSILLVTHSGDQIVTHCDRAILLNGGQMLDSGDTRWVVNRYMDLLFGKNKKVEYETAINDSSITETAENNYSLNLSSDTFNTHPGYNQYEYRWGDGSATILDYYLTANNTEFPLITSSGQSISLTVSVKFNRTLIRPIFGFTIKTKEGLTVYGANSETLETKDIHELGEVDSVVKITANFDCLLAPGDYFISLGIATKRGEEVIPHDRRYDSIHLYVGPTTFFFGLTNLNLSLSAQRV